MKKKGELNRILSKTHIAELDDPIILHNFGESVARLRTSKGLTQGDMAYLLGVSKQTYIRIENGSTDKINMICAIKIATIFHVPVKELCGYDMDDMNLYNSMIQATDRTRRLIASILRIDAENQKRIQPHIEGNEYMIDCLSCANNLQDGVPADRFYHKVVNISEYRTQSWYRDADAIIEVNSNAYTPLYHKGDRLVISCRTPQDGDIGIFIRDGKFYMRKYVSADDYAFLELLTLPQDEANPFFAVGRNDRCEIEHWVKFGVVLEVI